MLTLLFFRSKLQKYKLIRLDDVNAVFKSFGVVDDTPSSRRGLTYENLDLKSMRIINRLVQYLEKE